MNRQTWWLSFCDPKKPKGQSFLGVCVVEVNQNDAAEAYVYLLTKHGFVKPGADWMKAAMQKAWSLGINPGGEVQASRVDEGDPDVLRRTPLDRLLTADELKGLDLV